ncbi:MAG TPA: gamma-glutamyl-gamma-aminobutyrate hydrolase family protein, partial [Acidobacteriota bacterium]|nr:gamma-glutamyl-gamma-aminobutyrate hydrolase family protein [Acidobacteriota bacterium]
MPVTSSPRPLIGISTRLNPTDDTNYLRQTYGRAVFAAGGVPVLVPIIPDAVYINALVPRLDGVLLPGSNSDIDPYRYGQAPHVNLGEVFPERDEVDQLLLAAAESLHLPV